MATSRSIVWHSEPLLTILLLCNGASILFTTCCHYYYYYLLFSSCSTVCLAFSFIYTTLLLLTAIFMGILNDFLLVIFNLQKNIQKLQLQRILGYTVEKKIKFLLKKKNSSVYWHIIKIERKSEYNEKAIDYDVFFWHQNVERKLLKIARWLFCQIKLFCELERVR